MTTDRDRLAKIKTAIDDVPPIGAEEDHGRLEREDLDWLIAELEAAWEREAATHQDAEKLGRLLAEHTEQDHD